MSKSQSDDGESFVTLNHFGEGESGDKYVTGVSKVNPKVGFIHIDRYEYFRGQQNSDYVPLHRLVAVAEYGIEEVKEKHVHHKNGVRFDNRPSNLELMSDVDHTLHEQRKEPLEKKLRGQSDEMVAKALEKAGYSDAAKSVTGDD